MKNCSRCKQLKPILEFSKNRTIEDGYNNWCKPCNKLYHKQWNCKNKKKKSDYYRKTVWGITSDEYFKMIKSQDGRCGGCKRTEEEIRASSYYRSDNAIFAIDHCHTNGDVRGLLCFQCNAALGQVKDSIPTLLGLINYLDIFHQKENRE